MTPERREAEFKRRQQPEFRLQCAVADMLWKLALPGWWWSAIPSGEKRTIETGERLKRAGLKAGMFDYMLIGPPGGPSGVVHFLELKVGLNKLTQQQLEFEGMLCARQIPNAVVWGFADAEAKLREWGVLRQEARGIR